MAATDEAVDWAGGLDELVERIARCGEEEAVPVSERRRGELDAGLRLEARRAEELAFQVVGPAVQRTDDVLGVAAAFQHDGLTVAADIR